MKLGMTGRLGYDYVTVFSFMLTDQIKVSSMTHPFSLLSMQPLYTLHVVHLIMKFSLQI